MVGQGEHDIKMYWSSPERSLSLDARPVRKLTDYLGVLRTVVFCTEDVQLVKGAARARRRFLDLLLSQTYPAYLPHLQRYTRALRSRNALLKQPRPDPTALDGFSRELVKSRRRDHSACGAELVPEALAAGPAGLSPHLQ